MSFPRRYHSYDVFLIDAQIERERRARNHVSDRRFLDAQMRDDPKWTPCQCDLCRESRVVPQPEYALPTAITEIVELTNPEWLTKHTAQRGFKVRLRNGTEHFIAVRGPNETSSCVSPECACEEICPAVCRLLMLLARQRSRH